MIKIHETLSADLFEPLHQMLLKISIKKKSKSNNRSGFPVDHRAMTLGITKGRFNGIVGLSYFSKKYPHIYEEVMKIGKLICPFDFKSIHVNNNVICPKHYDSKNVGESLLVSFGNYEGCKIVIEGTAYDAKYTPIIFNGSSLEHWNTDDLIGNKYSLVYFN
jgi:hypothetical protein